MSPTNWNECNVNAATEGGILFGGLVTEEEYISPFSECNQPGGNWQESRDSVPTLSEKNRTSATTWAEVNH